MHNQSISNLSSSGGINNYWWYGRTPKCTLPGPST